MNKRQKDINNSLNNFEFEDKITNIKKKYKNELIDYDYIDNLAAFSTLELKGSLRYINKYSEELKYGGLLIKIYNEPIRNKWYAIIKKSNNKKYNILFNTNYIFYKKSKSDQLKDWAEYFIAQVDDGNYNIN